MSRRGKVARAIEILALTIAVLGTLVVVSEPANAALASPNVCVGDLSVYSRPTSTFAGGGASCPIHGATYTGTVGHAVNLCEPGVHKMPIIEQRYLAGVAPRSTVWTFERLGSFGLLTVTTPAGKSLATGLYQLFATNCARSTGVFNLNFVRVERSQPLTPVTALSCHVQGSIAVSTVLDGDPSLIQGTAAGGGPCTSTGAPWQLTFSGAGFQKSIPRTGCGAFASDLVGGVMHFSRPGGGPPVPMDQVWTGRARTNAGTLIDIESGPGPVGVGTLSYAPDYCNESGSGPAWFGPHTFTADIVFLLV